MYLCRSTIDPEPDDTPIRHPSRLGTPLSTLVSPSPVPHLNSQSNPVLMRLQRRAQSTSLAPWQIALIVVGAVIFLVLTYAFYTIFRLRRSKQPDQYSLGLKIFDFSSPRRTAAPGTNASASRRRVDDRSKRRRGSAHLSSADDGRVGKTVGGGDEDKEMDPPVKLSRLLKNESAQPIHRSSPLGASPSTVSMMHYNEGEEEELSPPPPPTGSTVRPSTGFTSTSSITRTSFPSPYTKGSASIHDIASIKDYATTKESASVGSPTLSSPIHSFNGDPISTSFKSTGGFSLGNTLSAALDKHRHRRGSKSSTATAPTPLSPPINPNPGLASPPHSGSAISTRPRSQTHSDTQTKPPRSRGHTSRSQTRTLDDGQNYETPTSAGGGGPSSPLSPSSLGASLGLFARHNTTSNHSHSHSHHAQQPSKPNHATAARQLTKSTTSHHLSKEDGWRDHTYDRDLEREHFDDADSVAHTIRASFEDDNYYHTLGEQEREMEMDEQISTSFTTQSGMTGSGSGTSNAHGDITPRGGGGGGATTPRIASPRTGTSTGRLGSSHSTASHAHTFTPPTTAMSRTTFAENGVAVPFSGIGLAFGRAGRDTPVDTPRDGKDKENNRRRGRERNEE